MSVTVRDVARMAGVSPSTVSRALSSPAMVSPRTRERVVAAAAALGYRPNRAARGLTTGRTGALGLIVPDIANPFFPGVVKGVQSRAREADQAVFLVDTDEDGGKEAEVVRVLARQVDGIVLCSPRMSDEELREVSGETTLVLLHRRLDCLPSVTVANDDGMRQAVAHLAALGHRRIAWVGGPRQSWSNGERERGLHAATSALGLDLVEVGNFPPHYESGVAAADLVIAAGVTAVVAYNDLLGLGLLNRLAARGVAVPGEISVVGCDDVPMAGMTAPPLTTVALPQQSAGRTAVDLLLQLLDPSGRGRATHRELAAQLMVRASTGVAPKH